MNEVLFAAVLALAWFGAVNLALSALAAAVGSLIERGVIRPRIASAAAILLGLKVVPGGAALLFMLAVFLPAHWIFEPAGADESLGFTLGAFGALGAAVLARTGRRAVRDARITRRLEQSWEGLVSGPRRLLAGNLPVYCMAGDAPIISLAGLRRPRVFVARRVMESFSPEELDVSLAHELAHREARDNLKRVAVACSPDLLSLWSAGRRLEHRWRAAVEFAADARAVHGSDERALSLASALLKVARLSPGDAAPSPGSALYDGTLLWARIDRLLAPVERARSPRPIRLVWSMAIGAMVALAAVAAAEGVWFGVHLATEDLVRFLP